MRSLVFLLLLISPFLLAAAVHAEQTGTINLTTANNTTFVTGLQGKTINYCSSNADCRDATNYRCLLDYDGVSFNSTFGGWCAPAAQASCAHKDSDSASYDNTSSGSSSCTNSTAYRTCSSGNWSATTVCTDGQVCGSGACVTPSSSSGGGGGGGSSSNTSSASLASISITLYPSPFDVTQGDNVTVKINATNGNITQKNVTISLSGISVSWFTIAPEVVNSLNIKASVSFNVSFFIPKTAEVKNYSITITASTSNASVTGSATFSIRVLPSNDTIEQQLKPSFSLYTQQLAELENRLSQEKQGFGEAKEKKIENLIKLANSKLDEAKQLLDQGKAFESKVQTDEVNQLVDDIKAAFDQKEEQAAQEQADFAFFIILGVVVAAAAGFVAFLFWPAKEGGYSREAGWLGGGKEKKGFMGKIRNKLVKRKKKEESFFGEDKRSG